MKTPRSFLAAALLLPLLALSGCGYHLGGLRATALKDKDSFCVNMFANYTTQPMVAMQMTTALADALQRDGAFRMASPSDCDFRIDGAVTSIHRESLRTDSDDTYVSAEIGLVVHVSYKVTDCDTGKVLMEGTTQATGSYFNDVGSVQSARDAALSYATRKASDKIVIDLTIP